LTKKNRLPKFQFFIEISISYQNFDFSMFDRHFYRWPTNLFLTKITIFDQKFDFWPKFWFLTKISIFDRNFDLLPKFRFLTKILIFDQYFDFLTKIRIFNPNFCCILLTTTFGPHCGVTYRNSRLLISQSLTLLVGVFTLFYCRVKREIPSGQNKFHSSKTNSKTASRDYCPKRGSRNSEYWRLLSQSGKHFAICRGSCLP